MSKKKWAAVFTVAALLVVMASVTFGEGVWYYASGRDGVNIYVQAYFFANQKVSTTSYGLTKGKYVRQVQVKLSEGPYREIKKSSAASSTADSKKHQVSIYHFNNPFQTSSASKTWYYF